MNPSRRLTLSKINLIRYDAQRAFYDNLWEDHLPFSDWIPIQFREIHNRIQSYPNTHIQKYIWVSSSTMSK